MRQIRILIVDDEPEFRKIVAEAMTNAGYQVESAHNSNTATELCRTFLPHVVLLDVMLTDETGIDILEKIRELDKQVKVIMISGMLDLDIAKEAIIRGAEEYFTKPVDFKKLDRLIQKLTKDSLG